MRHSVLKQSPRHPQEEDCQPLAGCDGDDLLSLARRLRHYLLDTRSSLGAAASELGHTFDECPPRPRTPDAVSLRGTLEHCLDLASEARNLSAAVAHDLGAAPLATANDCGK